MVSDNTYLFYVKISRYMHAHLSFISELVYRILKFSLICPQVNLYSFFFFSRVFQMSIYGTVLNIRRPFSKS